MSAAVIASGNAAPVLEFAEHDFDTMALPIQGLVIWCLAFSTTRGWDAEGDSVLDKPHGTDLLSYAGGMAGTVRASDTSEALEITPHGAA